MNQPARRHALCRLLGAAIALLLCLPSAGVAQSPLLAIDDYWQQIEATHAIVQDLRSAPRAEQVLSLAALAAQWQQVSQVALPDGALIVVDHSALARALQADPPDLAHVEQMLVTLLASRNQWPAGRHSADDLRPLQAILQRAEFQSQPATPSPIETWWNNLIARLNRWLARLFPESTGDGVNSALSWALNIAGAVALAALLMYAGRELAASLAAEAHLRTDGGDGSAPLTADSAFQRAQQLAEGRDYRTAVRYLYLSALLTLDERGALRYDRSKTNREYLRSVAGQPALAVALREVIDVFDRVWYGFQPLDAASYARYESHVAELRRP